MELDNPNLPHWPEFMAIFEKHNDMVMQEIVNKTATRASIIFNLTIKESKEYLRNRINALSKRRVG